MKNAGQRQRNYTMDRAVTNFPKTSVMGVDQSQQPQSAIKDGRSVISETPSQIGGKRGKSNAAPTIKSNLQNIIEDEAPDFLRDANLETPARGRLNTKATNKSKISDHKDTESKGSKLGLKHKAANNETAKSSTKNSVAADKEARGGKATKKASNTNEFVHRTGEDMHNSLYAKLRNY